MKIPLSWLREFVDVSVAPARLGQDLSRIGLECGGIETDASETVLDLEVTTNRVDCMNVYGVAREVATLYGLRLRPLDVSFVEDGPAAHDALQVRVEASDLCPRFCARVLDVTPGPSPQWIQDRLHQVGVRSVNSVVDLTNYVMIEMGHPSHAFDLERITEGRLVARWAAEGEMLRTLDGVERPLGSRIGVVAGIDGPLALAGIMGGAASEVSEATRTVALEAAYWAPLAIRRGAKALGMHTEASHRFERGADPEGPVVATARIAHLLGRMGGGSVRKGLIDEHFLPLTCREIRLHPQRLSRLLGAEVAKPDLVRILAALGFEMHEEGEAWRVVVPTWRSDVTREVDLIEEVARHHGLNAIEATLPASCDVNGLRPRQRRERSMRDVLAGVGLTEVIQNGFVNPEVAGTSAGPVARLRNPLAEDQGALRSSLILPGLLDVLQRNVRHGRHDVRIFEIGRVFIPDGRAVREEARLGLLIAGTADPPHWSERMRAADFYDMTGLIEHLCRRIGWSDVRIEPEGERPSFLHPGRSACVVGGERLLGFVGAIHPEMARIWDVPEGAFVAEIELEPLLASAPPVQALPLQRFPSTSRDLSILVDTHLAARTLERWIREAAGVTLRDLTIADRYDRPPVPEGRVSLLVKLVYQDPQRTLTNEEVDASVQAVAEALRGRGAEIRGE